MKLLRQELEFISQAIKHPTFAAWVLGSWLWAYITFDGHGNGAFLFAFILIIQSIIDIKHGLLTHTLNALLALLGLVVAPQLLDLSLMQALAGMVLFFAVFAFMAWLAGRLAGRPALGGGDLWLVAALGTWLGVEGLPPFLLALALIGLTLLAIRRFLPGRKAQFPFGPALAAAGWLTLLHQSLYWKCIIYLTA